MIILWYNSDNKGRRRRRNSAKNQKSIKRKGRGKEAHHKVMIGFSEGQLSRLGWTNVWARRQSWRPLSPSTVVMSTAPI